jgi:DNA-binding NtrC family response regulator/lipopolysaccharide biosynthesis regulator YciM
MQPLLDRKDFAGALDCYTQFTTSGETIDGSMAIPHHLASKAHLALQDLTGALKCARLAQAAASKDGDSTVLAEIFLTLGAILRDLGQVRESLRAYSDAESIFRRNDHTEGRCRALNQMAGVYFKQTDYRHALSTLLEALEMARTIGDNAKIAYMMGNIGRIQTFLGELADAERHLRTNIELSEDLGDQLEAARARLSLGYVQMQRGSYDEAEQSFREAQAALIISGNRRDEAICLSYLGELARRRGELADSQIMLDKALHVAEKVAPETTLVGRILRQQAETMLAVGNHRAAQKLVARALPIMGGNGDLVTCGALWKLQAVLLENHKPSDSLAAIHKALDLLTESGVRYELAEALVAAGNLKIFSVRQRMTYLYRAEEIFAHAGLLARCNEVQITIDRLDHVNLETGEAAGSSIVDSDLDYFTCSPSVIKIKEDMLKCGGSDMPILLTGPTGVGKTKLAAYFHRKVFPKRPFIVINCAAIPETLLESELFGYAPGAFTGAERRKIGHFEAANNGVLLLDEIGDMPLSLQAKLLGVIERRKITPLGSVEEIDLDVRLIAATNQPLSELVAQGKFRSDLYYRLSAINFAIPALKDRPEDIPLLAGYFLRKHQLLGTDESVPPELLRYLMAQEWHGNIRELDYAIQKIRSMGRSIEHGDLLTMYPAIATNRPAATVGNLFEQVEEFERKLLVQALRAVGGNKSQAARMLGIHEATVRTKLKRYGLEQTFDAPALGNC